MNYTINGKFSQVNCLDRRVLCNYPCSRTGQESNERRESDSARIMLALLQ